MKKSIQMLLILFFIQFVAPIFAQTRQKPEIYIETGHNEIVSSVVFSPDGRYLASSSWDNTVKIWDAATGRELKTLEGHKNHVELVVFSPDSRILVSSGENLKFWDVETGRELKPLDEDSEDKFQAQFSNLFSVKSVAFSPDGKYLASCGRNFKLWDVRRGAKVKTLAGISSCDSVAFSPNENVLAISYENTVEIWNPESGEKTKTLAAKYGVESEIIFSSDGKYLAGCSWKSNTISLWEAKTGKELKPLVTGLKAFIHAIAFSPDGLYLASASNSSSLFPNQEKINLIHLWNIATGEKVTTMKGQSNEITSLAIHPTGKILASGSNDNTIKLWEIPGGKELNTLTNHTLNIQSIAFENKDKQLKSISENGIAKFWDFENGIELKTEAEKISPLKKFENISAYSPDKKYIASSELSSGNIELKEVATDKVKILETAAPLPKFVFSPDSKYLASETTVGIFLWDVQSGEIKDVFEYRKGIITPKAFSSDGKLLASVSEENTIRLWNIENGRELKSFVGNVPINSVTINDQKSYLAIASSDGKITLWDIKSGNQIISLIALDESEWVIVTPDGRFDTNKSLDDIEGLHWIVNDEILKPLPLDVFLRQYYEPGLLRRVLKCTEENDCDKEFKLLPSITDINRVQPKVVIKEIKSAANTTDLADVTVEIENVTDDVSISATDRTKKKRLSSGVFDVRLFRDGQMIGNSTPTEKLEKFYQAAPDLIEQNKKYFAETKQLTNTPEDEAWRTANNLAEVKGVKFDGKSKYIYTFKNIKLPHDGRKAVEFTAYAFNADRVKSDNVVKTFPIPATVANKPQPKRAFVIAFGVNKYQSSSWDLQFAANDARAMREILADKLRKIGNFAEVVEIPLISDDETISGKTLQKREATKQNVQTVLDLLAGKTPDEKRLKTLTAALGAETVGKIKPANPEDAVFISFSSHGYADRNGIFYILPTDIGAGLPRTVTPELLKNSISSDELSLWLRDVDAGEMVMIVDACNAEAAVKNSEFKPAPMGSRGLGQLAYDKGMKILTATQAANVAIETGAIGHGLLTYALVGEGLGKENKADFRAADKTINLKEWLEYGEFRVPGLYDDLLNKRLKIVGKGTDVIDLSGDNPKLNSSSQTPVLFDFTKRRQELTLVRLP